MTTGIAAPRRIIRRPRLTSMLDESSARVHLLLAPAGYGKTTLAREWLSDPERSDVWYMGGPASADVAALAAGISEAARRIIPNAGTRMRERLRATGEAEKDVDILAELLAEDVQSWPSNAWLAFDDYHFATASAASERFVDLLTQHTPIQMMIASRARPRWATARRVLYGELHQIERESLAMNDEEVQEVVGRDLPELARFLQKARGWPAVIGLVGLSSSDLKVTNAVPKQLYAYFAQELYESVPIEHRLELGRLSFASRFDREFADQVLGDKVGEVLQSGIQKGILSQPDPGLFDFHPLLADFLSERAFRSSTQKQQAAERVGQVFLAVGRWDEAVDIACRFGLPGLLAATLEVSLYPLLDSGRLATVNRWLEAGAILLSDSPLLDLAEAEVAFRVGNHSRAEAMAEQAAGRLGSDSALSSRAYFRAGHSALLASREEASISHFENARDAAREAQDLREALFGLYSAMSELEWPEAGDVLIELDRFDLDSPDDQMRTLVARLTNALRTGGLEEALGLASSASVALERASNPMIITSFLHTYSNVSSLAGRYDQGLRTAKELISMGKERRLGFVHPFAVLDRGIAHLGLRSFAGANHDVDLVAALAPNDAHLQGNAATLRCRLLLTIGRATAAVEATEEGLLDEKPPAGFHAELLAYRALALACADDVDRALGELIQAEEVSKQALVVRVLAPAVRGICSTTRGEREEHAHATWVAATATGHVDTLVCAYRAFPKLMEDLMTVADSARLVGIMIRANDSHIAQHAGLAVPRQRRVVKPHLTAREEEVMDLVASGLTNREVADALFIEESTVKVHLRHIYEKFGVRGRSEAVPRWLARL
jgi:LuxR family transcriptional regulator, maltose regulon positive regulatory protein